VIFSRIEMQAEQPELDVIEREAPPQSRAMN
jgi:hypothetical protein